MTPNQKQGSRQAKVSSQKPRLRGPARQEPVAQFEEPNLLALQRAVANPAMAGPTDLLALGRRYGNRAVQRLLAQRQPQAQAIRIGPDVLSKHGVYDPTSADVRAMMRGKVNQAAQKYDMSKGHKSQAGVLQRYKVWAGTPISDGGAFMLLGKQNLLATATAIAESNEALEKAGALVRLIGKTAPAMSIESASRYQQVQITANGRELVADHKTEKWRRLQAKEKKKGSFVTFADCFRTSGVVSGMNPDDPSSTMILKLPTGNVQVMSDVEASKYNIVKSTAAKAAASFFLHAIPRFVQELATLKTTDRDYEKMHAELSERVQFVQTSPGTSGPSAYRLILGHEKSKQRFCDLFGINASAAPAIGTALVQVGDPYERAEAQKQGEDKWNYHWAGTVMVDGTDYVTLENLAMEIDEFSEAEKELNKDLLDQPFLEKNDYLNARWYFKLYGKGKGQSFHEQSLKDPHATPSGITLPVESQV